jgi:NAD(P)-dependent dehydrogenase (short-subunit alcohol dehydrogenase family)
VRLVEHIKKTEGRLDILVANAGATWGSSFEDAPDHASVKILDLNVRGVFLLAQKWVETPEAILVSADEITDLRRCWKLQGRGKIRQEL